MVLVFEILMIHQVGLPGMVLAWKSGFSTLQIYHTWMNKRMVRIEPMNTLLKQRKAVVQRKQAKPAESTRPEEVYGTCGEEKTDTNKNMSTMFDILRKISFAQTVENIFALSFLV